MALPPLDNRWYLHICPRVDGMMTHSTDNLRIRVGHNLPRNELYSFTNFYTQEYTSVEFLQKPGLQSGFELGSLFLPGLESCAIQCGSGYLN